MLAGMAGGARLGPGEVGVLPAARQVDPQRGPGPGRRQRGAKVRGSGPIPARLESDIITIMASEKTHFSSAYDRHAWYSRSWTRMWV